MTKKTDRAGATAIVDSFLIDLIDECPHCGAKAHFTRLFQDSYVRDDRGLTYYLVLRCVPCKKLVLKTLRFSQNRYSDTEDLTFDGWVDKFPTGSTAIASKYVSNVPPDVLEDFREGVMCLDIGCYKAAAGMFRRSLQVAALQLGADPSQDLIDQIRNLPGLTPDIKDWAHNIRIFGNWGVHPQDDNLKDVNEEVAKETQSFLEEFFNYVYVMPKRVAQARRTPPKQEEVAE